MGTSASKPVVDPEARDMTETSDISDCVPSPVDRKVFLSSNHKEDRRRSEFLNPVFESLGRYVDKDTETIPKVNSGRVPLSVPL